MILQYKLAKGYFTVSVILALVAGTVVAAAMELRTSALYTMQHGSSFGVFPLWTPKV